MVSARLKPGMPTSSSSTSGLPLLLFFVLPTLCARLFAFWITFKLNKLGSFESLPEWSLLSLKTRKKPKT